MKKSLPIAFAVALGCSAPETALSAPPQAAATKWLVVPNADIFARFYPQAAIREEVDGKVVLDCRLDAAGIPTGCSISEENPQGLGFGESAIRLSRFFRAATVANGKPTAGTAVRIPISFRQPQ